MSLLCRLGRHRPRGIPRWNDGYYFAVCERCGSDLVRTAFERWHVPNGYRVVWSDRPPESRPEVALMPSEDRGPTASGTSERRAEPAQAAGVAPVPAAPVAGPDRDQPTVALPPFPSAGLSSESPSPQGGVAAGDATAEPEAPSLPSEAPAPPAAASQGRLPIQEVLAQLHAEEAANPDEKTEPAPEAPPAPRRRPAWDFMDDDPFAQGSSSRPAPVGGSRERSSPLDRSLAGTSGNEAVSPPPRRSERWRAVRSAVSNFLSGPAEPNSVLVIALALVVAVGVAVALALALPSAEPSSGAGVASARPDRSGVGVGTGELSDPFAVSAPDISGAEAETPMPEQSDQGAGASEERGYVAASLLICRAAPDRQARRVRNLLRGREVRVLGREGEWASVLYRDGQCWAQARFISPAPPL